ncbi:hypothetical protein [Candidatus Reidiella endopervernicosa]|uniref:hypothetical protein n=1 Tax=Candidatus Reidiella endopervernicosa TaxID=2738883 RepID=UPI003B96910D
MATDWEDYAHHMVKVLEAEPSLHNSAGSGAMFLVPKSAPDQIRTAWASFGPRCLGPDLYQAVIKMLDLA